MISVKPGAAYFWRNGTDSESINAQNDAIDAWLQENVLPGQWLEHGVLVSTCVYTFEREEDAVAFKLKFGI